MEKPWTLQKTPCVYKLSQSTESVGSTCRRVSISVIKYVRTYLVRFAQSNLHASGKSRGFGKIVRSQTSKTSPIWVGYRYETEWPIVYSIK